MEIIAEEKGIDRNSHSHLHLPMQSQIALMFMAVMVMFAVFASLLNSLIITNNFEDELGEKAEKYMQYIFNGYIESIAKPKSPDFKDNLKKILRDEGVLSISLHDKNTGYILNVGKKNIIHQSVFKHNNENNLSVNTYDDIRYYNYFVPEEYKTDYKNKENSVRKKGSKITYLQNDLNYILLGFDSKMVSSTALNAFVWTFLLTMIAAICMMFIAVVVIRRFTKPFDRLSSAMANAQLGERGVRVKPDGASEVYSMGIAFNSMISVLERREDRLITQKSKLEDEIHERLSAELKLKNTTSRLQAIFQNAADGIVVVSSESEIISINPSAENIYGYKEGELVGQNFRKIMEERFIQMVFSICKEGDSNNFDNEYKTLALTKSGRKIPIEMSVSHMLHSGVENFLVIVRDISDRIKAEEELNNYRIHLEAMVEEQTKDIAKSRDSAKAGERAMSAFLSNMSHELRTPMHGVLSFASIALKKIDLVSTDKTKEYLSEIKSSGEHLLDIINDLLDLSKLKSGKMLYHRSEKSFVNLVEAMNREMAGLARDKSITFELEIKGAEFQVCYDEKRMMQVIRNLYANAIKFSLSDVPITIIIDYTQEKKLAFSIFNFGASVPEGEEIKIFDNFSQSSNTATNAGGTGLGLPICKEIVETGHGGEIWSAPGIKDGAKFIMEIPLNIDLSDTPDYKEARHF